MSNGKTIRIFLESGSVNGIRHAEIVNWTGQAIACPRPMVQSLKAWTEAHRPSVYFLFGDDPQTGRAAAYIGESENFLERLKEHISKKDFWSEVIFFTSKDDNLTKSHVKYLESKLVHMAIKTDRHVLMNDTQPKEPMLPRSDRVSMDQFVDHIQTLLGVLGHKTLEPLTTIRSTVSDELKPREQAGLAPDPSAQPIDAQINNLLDQSVQLKVKSINATGVLTAEGLLVLEGSDFSVEPQKSLSSGCLLTRQQLVKNGVVTSTERGYQFAKQHLFSSASQAAAVIVGYSINGRIAWRLKDGRTIKAYEDDL